MALSSVTLYPMYVSLKIYPPTEMLPEMRNTTQGVVMDSSFYESVVRPGFSSISRYYDIEGRRKRE